MFTIIAGYVKVDTYERAVIPIAAPKSELNMARKSVRTHPVPSYAISSIAPASNPSSDIVIARIKRVQMWGSF